jgi:hypothetical protein
MKTPELRAVRRFFKKYLTDMTPDVRDEIEALDVIDDDFIGMLLTWEELGAYDNFQEVIVGKSALIDIKHFSKEISPKDFDKLNLKRVTPHFYIPDYAHGYEGLANFNRMITIRNSKLGQAL